MKFTDEELSRILSAHANGELRRGGYSMAVHPDAEPKVCVNQAALGVAGEDDCVWPGYSDGGWMDDAANWFDVNYNNGWPLNKFLRELEKQGLA